MPKEVNLGKQQEFLERAAGIKPAAPAPPPAPLPAASAPTSLQPNTLLPAGKLVGGQLKRPVPYTEAELATLGEAGWDTSNKPVPVEMAKVLAKEMELRRQETEVGNLPPPIDPRTPPLKVETHTLEQATPEQKKRLLGALESALAQEAAFKEQQQDEAKLAAMPAGVGEALQLARQEPAPAPAAIGLEVEDDLKRKPATASQATPSEAAAAPASNTGADAKEAFCPNCGWDQSMVDIPEPAYADKLAFVQSVLGQRPFVKEYDLMGGSVRVTFRSLTTRELDLIWRQTFADRDKGKLVHELDFQEQLNRYRLFLQLQSLKAMTPDGFFHDLPDGLNAEVNPKARAFYKFETPLAEGETVLPLIEEYLCREVLPTETLFRMVNNECRQFNRLAARLEGMVDNSDFWKPTEELS